MSANPAHGSAAERSRARQCHVRQAMVIACVGCAMVLLTSLDARAQVGDHGGFTDVTQEVGIYHRQRRELSRGINGYTSGGAAVGDFFGDGLLDLFVTRHDDTDILYRNMGDGTFEDVTAEVFGDEMTNAQTNGAMFADLNNDGALDLYVTANGENRHYLYMNDGNGKLTEQAFERGVAHYLGEDVKHVGMSVTAGDYDNDGLLDLYVSDWQLRSAGEPALNRLFHNTGDGYFEDVTVSAGIDTPKNQSGFSGRFADMNGNGRMDLLAVNDFRNSQYYENNGDGTFTEARTKYRTGTSDSEMGSTVADYNNNGELDWFVTAIGDLSGNRLYRNDIHREIDGIYFTEQSVPAGVQNGYWGWGTSFIDYDNNGLRDIVMVNGWNQSGYMDKPMRFWRNGGEEANFTFTEISEELGLTDRGQGRGLLVGDFFGNGFQDILVLNHAGEPVLYRNEGNDNSWLRINTVGEVTNRMGIGAFITVVPDLDADFALVHDVNLGANFLAHNETTAHFGLGGFEGLIDYIHIRWPSGIEQEFFDIEPNQLLTIHELDGIETLTMAVPEPTSLALLAGAGALLLRRRGAGSAKRCVDDGCAV